MNGSYRLIWSDIRQDWIVADENTPARGKRALTASRLISAAVGATLTQGGYIALAAPPAPTALPTGGQVVSGRASITQSGSLMTINQATGKAILNWNTFNIGASAAVNFVQPSSSSVALNRVLSSDPSGIFGSLTANGQVFLVNPSGVLFGPGARVDVGGLVASALSIRNEDFLAGNYLFSRIGGAGSVVNQGDIAAKYVALLAPEARNEGVITARQGTVALVAGEAVTLGISGNDLIDVQVDKASINTWVENKHLIQADAGTVILSAQSASQLLGQVVNSGTVEANGITANGGVIRLTASSDIRNTGALSADAGTNGKGGAVSLIADLANPASRSTVSGAISARGGSTSGDGGFIETSAARLRIDDSARIDTSAANGRAGQWLLDPFDFTIAAANGDITGAALSTALGSSNVTIATGNTNVSCTGVACGTGTSSVNGDINVNDTVTWAAAKNLTLSAWRNVNINAPINVNGAGGLALEFAQYDVTANFPGGTYFVNAPVSLAAGATFSTKIASDGPTVPYTVIRDNAALAAVSGNLAGNYVLGTDVAATTNPWAPLGNTATPFTGNFDGLGHKVMNVTHPNGSGSDADVGLFGASMGLIQNVGVTNVNVDGSTNVGALVGNNNGFVVNSYAQGTVTGSGAGAVGAIGGLVGYSQGPVIQSYADVTVSATTGDQSSGSPLAARTGGIGGLVGVLGTSVTASYAKGSVTGLNAVGGLVGYSAGAIDSSYATGLVNSGTPGTNVGGLIGQVDYGGFTPFVFKSFWDTTTTGQSTTAMGGADDVTGLATAAMQTPATFTNVGWDTGTQWELRSNQYPLLKQMLTPVYVIANNISTTYSGTAFSAFTNTVSPSTPGSAYAGTVTYTPLPASPTNVGSYTVTPAGVSVTAPSDQQGYRIELTPGTLAITPATLTLSGTQVYNGGTAFAGSNLTANGVNGETFTVTGAGATGNLSTKNVQTNQLLASIAGLNLGTSGNGGASTNYNALSTTGSSVSVTPAALTLSGTQVYTGLTAFAGSNLTANGVNGETFTVTGAGATGNLSTKNVQTNQLLASITGLNLGTSGNGGVSSNYNALSTTGSSVSVTPATLTVTADMANKTSGQPNPALSGSVTGFVGGDTLGTATTGTEVFSTTATTSSTAGSYPVTGAGLTANNGNYLFAQAASNATALTVTASTPQTPMQSAAFATSNQFQADWKAQYKLAVDQIENEYKTDFKTSYTNSQTNFENSATVAGMISKGYTAKDFHDNKIPLSYLISYDFKNQTRGSSTEYSGGGGKYSNTYKFTTDYIHVSGTLAYTDEELLAAGYTQKEINAAKNTAAAGLNVTTNLTTEREDSYKEKQSAERSAKFADAAASSATAKAK